MRLNNPYECPVCGKLTCYGIACETCNIDDEQDTCKHIVLCTCSLIDYIKAVFNVKEKLNIKETEIISLILHNNILRQRIKDQSTLLDLQELRIKILNT